MCLFGYRDLSKKRRGETSTLEQTGALHQYSAFAGIDFSVQLAEIVVDCHWQVDGFTSPLSGSARARAVVALAKKQGARQQPEREVLVDSKPWIIRV